MWYPVSDSVATEPVTRADAQAQVAADEADFNTSLDMLIAAARAHVEGYCNRLFASHAMAWTCDGFSDFGRLPAAPAVSISAITYVDADGSGQTLGAEVYDLRQDGLEPRITLKAGQSWPAIQPGSRITVNGVFGGHLPHDVKHAILLLVGDGFTTRENVARPVWTAVDALLANHRRGAW